MSAARLAPFDLAGWPAIAGRLQVDRNTAMTWAEKAPRPWMATLPYWDSPWGPRAIAAQLDIWKAGLVVPGAAARWARRLARAGRPGLAKCRPRAE